MVTKTTPTRDGKNAKTAPKPKPQPKREVPSAISGLDVDERRAFEDWKREEERNRPAWKNPTKEELELEFLELLKEKSKKSKSGGALSMKKLSDCGNNDPCGDQMPKIDMEMLAEKVFQRLIFEARLERERIGWAG
jgi:hypothetical protein